MTIQIKDDDLRPTTLVNEISIVGLTFRDPSMDVFDRSDCKCDGSYQKNCDKMRAVWIKEAHKIS